MQRLKAETTWNYTEKLPKRLNRRCQIAEAGVAEKAKKGPGPLGRMLANAEATRLREAVDEKDKEIERLRGIMDKQK
jgi:hypothetical protein